MARAKKEYKNLTIKLEKTISDELEKYCEIMGQTKTMAIERILGTYFKNNKTRNNNDKV
ncbi:hypothetical protein JS518_14065 [Clostridiales bacterium FE2010]|nr:hypothetical protein JS518_14065 [Clostridiales bacterium FE2010]